MAINCYILSYACYTSTHTYNYTQLYNVTCTYTHLTQVCQKEMEGGMQVASLGRKVVANWTITSMSPLVFTITYTGGDPANNISRYLQTCHLKQAYVAYYNIMVVFPFSFTLDDQLSSLPMTQELHPWLSLTKKLRQ